MIPQPFIQELLARVDIVDVIGRYVQLKKAGANWIGLCPFHSEKSPSFTVSQSKQFYHCFGCGAHGSAISFLMEHLGLNFVEAVKQLAQDLGMTVPEERRDLSPEQQAVQQQTPGILQSLERAAGFYRNRLKDSPRAINYLKNRGLTGQTAKRFGLGYAPDGWRPLEAEFSEYAAEELVTAGLVVVKDEQAAEPAEGDSTDHTSPRDKRFDRFRDRIMFPIRNPKGQVIGFGGRVLDRGEPKYLNSPETPVFSKGRELYGLFEGRDAIRQANLVLVVEGYMDVVMLAQHGVENVVATLGTATTAQHLQKLMRLVDRIVFSFDGDSAGRRAARRALENALPQVADDKQLDFLFLPAEHDPDSFVRAFGREAFAERIQAATPFSDFFVQCAAEGLDLKSAEGRARFQAEARPLLQQLPLAAALRSQMMRRVAEIAQVSVNELESYLDAKPLPAAQRVSSQESGSDFGSARFVQGKERRANQLAVRRPPPTPLESRLRLLAALYPDLVHQWAEEDSGSEWLEGSLLPESTLQWFHWLLDLGATANFAAVCEALARIDPQSANALELAAANEANELDLQQAKGEFFSGVISLKRRTVSQALDELVGQGLLSDEDKQRYQGLTRLERELANLQLTAAAGQAGEPVRKTS